jgi:hypothetical protein
MMLSNFYELVTSISSGAVGELFEMLLEWEARFDRIKEGGEDMKYLMLCRANNDLIFEKLKVWDLGGLIESATTKNPPKSVFSFYHARPNYIDDDLIEDVVQSFIVYTGNLLAHGVPLQDIKNILRALPDNIYEVYKSALATYFPLLPMLSYLRDYSTGGDASGESVLVRLYHSANVDTLNNAPFIHFIPSTSSTLELYCQIGDRAKMLDIDASEPFVLVEEGNKLIIPSILQGVKELNKKIIYILSEGEDFENHISTILSSGIVEQHAIKSRGD